MLFGLSLTFLASQFLVGIAIIADIFSFQFKERRKIILFFIIAASCIALHYLLLERYAAAIIVGLGIFSFFLLSEYCLRVFFLQVISSDIGGIIFVKSKIWKMIFLLWIYRTF